MPATYQTVRLAPAPRPVRFVRVLLTQFRTERWPYSRDDKPAIARAEVLIAPR